MKKYGILVLLIIGCMIFTSCSGSEKAPGSEENSQGASNTSSIPATDYDHVPEGVSPLTGLSYEGDGRGVMVQIENTPQARPQSGISQADLIYEMEVESNITRLTAFFLAEHPKKVGPVRSTRKQHMHLWKEWDYPYAFYGGSQPTGQNIYEIIKQSDIQAPKIDGMEIEAAFSRSEDRESPHNAYADLSYILESLYNYQPKERSICFDQKTVIDGTGAEKIHFSYNPDNEIDYKYNETTKEYRRFINQKPMLDQENEQQVSVKNIIIQHANHYKVEGTVYTNIDLVGSGKTQYFTEGIMRIGRWERKDLDSPTIYYDENGKEISFRPGKSFIQIVRPEMVVDVE